MKLLIADNENVRGAYSERLSRRRKHALIVRMRKGVELRIIQ
jgi:hypothetical protein